MTQSSELDPRIEALINQACNGELDDAEFDELECLLADNEPARELYLDYFRLQSELHFLASLDRCDAAVLAALDADLAESPAESPAEASDGGRLRRAAVATWTFFSQPTPLSLSVAAGVIGLLITAMALLTPPVYQAFTQHGKNPPESADSRVVIGQLTALRSAVWTNGSGTPRRGARLFAGQRLAIESGLAEITFRSGAKVLLRGPATFDLMSANSGQIIAGRMTAAVPPSAIGFEVNTSMATIVDLGTEFTVGVERGGSENLYVFAGSVQVTGTGKNTSVLKQVVQAGEGITWSTTGHVRPLAGPPDEPYQQAAHAFRSNEVLLLSQNFDAEDTDNFDGTSLAVRRAGRLAFEIETRAAMTQQSLAGGQLRMIKAGGNSGRVRFQHMDRPDWYDWAAGSAADAILAGGGMRIAVDWTTTSTTTSNWISLNVGHLGQDAGEPTTRVNHPETDYGILLRGNGETQRYENGAGATTGSFPPSAAAQHVVVDLAFDSLDDGAVVGATVTVGRVQVDHHLFAWDNNHGELYLELGTTETGMLIDNLRIVAFAETNSESTKQQ